MNMLAPGNAIRDATDFPHGRSFVKAVGLTFIRPETAPIAWLSDSRLLLMSLVALTAPCCQEDRPDWLRDELPLHLILPIATLSAMFAIYFGVSYLQGVVPAGRALNILYFTLMAGWTASLQAIRFRLAPSNASRPATIHALSLAWLAICLAGSVNVARDLRDLGVTATRWREDNRRTYAALRHAVAGTAVLLPPRRETPSPMMDPGWLSRPDYWANTCAAHYFGVGSIVR